MLQALGRRFLENPLVGKEIATGLTGPRLGAAFTLVCVVYLATDLFCYLFFFLWDSSAPLEISAGAFLHGWHSIVAYGMLGLLLPLRVLGHIEGARAGRAFDQIVVTGVSPVRMCLGNWVLGLGYAAMLLLVTLPFEMMAYVFGGIEFGQILACYGLLLLYSNVMIALALGISVAASEWLAAPLTIVLLAVLGIVSFVPYMPAVIGEIGPVRFIMRQSMGTGFLSVAPAIVEAYAAAPRFFFLDIPIVIYTPLLWLCLMAPFVVLIVLGPRHFFLPGFNVFGSVVLPGDSKRSRFRRLRHGLVRRIEMAFYYENRPDWCARWDFPLRTLVTLLVVVLVWGAIYGVASANLTLERSLANDEGFHISFVLASVTLFFWMVSVGQTRLWTLFREKVGRFELSRGAILNASFLVLYAGLFLAEFVSFESLKAARAAGTIPTRFSDEIFAAYCDDRTAYVGVCALLFLNIYLLSRVLAWLFLNGGTWRVFVFFATNFLLWAPIAIYEITRQTADVFPPWFENFVYLSPYAILEAQDIFGVEDVPLRERFESCVLAHACLTAVLAAMGVGLWSWLRRGASWPSMPTRQERPGGYLGPAALLVAGLVALAGPAPSIEAQQGVVVFEGTAKSWSAEGDLPVEVAEISRGFDGRVFSGMVDFVTIVFENRGPETLRGRFRLRTAWGTNPLPWRDLELPTRTRVPVRYSLTGRYGTSQDLALEVESESRRLVVSPIGPAINVSQSASPPRIEEGGRFLILGGTSPRPIDWQRGTTGGAVVQIQCRPLALPEDWQSYAETSAVLLGSPDFSRWTLRQQQALYDYVRLGGSLVLFGKVDVEGLRAAAPWGTWLEGARERTVDGPGGRFRLVEFGDGGETLLYLERGAGEPVPLMSVRSVGAGRLGYLAFDPTSPNLPSTVRGSTQFWAEFTRRLPKSLQPVAFVPSHAGDSHLNDSGTLILIVGYFFLYTALLGPGLFIWFRQRARRRYLWGYALALCGGFAIGVFALDWIVHLRPSRGEIREMIVFGPGSTHGVSYSTVRLRSCGRQRHSLRVEGDHVSAFQVRRDYRMRNVPGEWMQPPVVDGSAAEIRLNLAPWSGRSLSLLSGARFRSGVAGSATYERQTRRLHFTIDSEVEPRNSRYLLITHNLDGDGALKSHELSGSRGRFRSTVPVSEGDGQLLGGPTGAPGDVAASTNVFRRDWRSILRARGGSTPRVLVAWSPASIQPGVTVSSEDVLFRQEGTVDANGRAYREYREFRLVDDASAPHHLLHQQLIVQEIEVEVR